MANEKRLIDANFTKRIIQGYIDESDHRIFKEVMRKVCDILDHSLAVDAVEVVRCKECVHRHKRWSCKGRPMDFFCANGERKYNGI